MTYISPLEGASHLWLKGNCANTGSKINPAVVMIISKAKRVSFILTTGQLIYTQPGQHTRCYELNM